MMSYHLEGRLLEVCNCRVLCPCWIGEDPDFGTCQSIVSWHFDKGTIDGVDVAGNTLAAVCQIPGNVLKGDWSVAIYLSDHATDEQEAALLKVYTGQAGGPVADLAKLIGNVVSVERAPIQFDVNGGKGTLKIGQDYHADLEPYTGPNGATTTLTDTVFSTVPGAPVFVGKAPVYRAMNKALGIDVSLKDHNALQSTFRFYA
jgi:hypothetical protein